MSHLHQARYPGLVLLLAGRCGLHRRAPGGGGPSPLPSLPALAAGQDALLLFPGRARLRLFLLPQFRSAGSHSGRPRSWALRDWGLMPGRGRGQSPPCGVEAEADLPGVAGPPWGLAFRDRFLPRVFCRGRGSQVCGLPDRWGRFGKGSALAERVPAAAAPGRTPVLGRLGLRGR